MILFVCSLFASAVGYVRRQRLAQAIYINLARPGSLIFRRFAFYASPSSAVANSNRHCSVSPTPGTTTTADPTNIVWTADQIEIVYSENLIQLELDQWHCFELIQHKLRRINDSPVYFIACMTPAVENDPKIKQTIEERCVPIAWKTDDNVEVLFGAAEKEFVDIACDWAENLILYRRFFDLTKLETVLLSTEFKKALFSSLSPPLISNNPIDVDQSLEDLQRSSLINGLEQLCLKDILNAKDLCRSIATFKNTPLDWFQSNGSLNQLDQQLDSPQSPALCIVKQPISSTSTSTILSATSGIPPSQSVLSAPICKFSPIEEVPPSPSLSPGASSCHYDAVSLSESAARYGGSGFMLPDADENDDRFRRSSPCHGFNDRLVDRHLYRHNSSRSASLTSVVVHEEPRRNSRKKQAKSSLNVSDNISSISRRFSMPAGSRSRSGSGTPLDSAAVGGVRFRRLSTVTREKPPNVLIYCGQDDDANNTLYEKLRRSLVQCLNSSRYVIYRLKNSQFLRDPWPTNTFCLVLADCRNLDEKFWSKLFDYFRSGGKLLFLCENRLLSSLSDTNSAKKRFGLLKLAFDGQSNVINKEVEKFLKKLSKNLNSRRVCEQCHVKDHDGHYKYTLSVLRETNSPLIFYMQNSNAHAGALFSDMTVDMFMTEGAMLIRQILERLGLDVEEQDGQRQTLTHGYLIFEKQNCISFEIEKRLLGKGVFDNTKVKLDFKENWPKDTKATDEYLPIVVCCQNQYSSVDFKWDTYFAYLKSVSLGRTVLYVPVVTSTMTVCDSLTQTLSTENSFIVIASRQLSGKGRSGNQWLSPVGCAMFTLGYHCSLSEKLGQYSGYVQHIVALAVVDSICSLPSFENFDLRLKWPNDIYYGRTTKVGGVLVTCTVKGDRLSFNIGCGINVSNSAPTVCLNDFLPESMEPFSCEQIIALTLTRLEELLHAFASNGHEAIWPLYYKYWLHDYQELTLAETNERVIVRGIDKYGYLEVRSRQGGKVFSLQPDGNSLDMMHNLIKMKEN